MLPMKAIDLSGKSPGGQRTPLIDVLPLDTPYVVQIFPIYACNLRCHYCIFGIPKEKRGFISDCTTMPWESYIKSINDLTLFPSKIKVLRFVGIGEPLLHPRIVDMIRYAVNSQCANTVELLTNGIGLTSDMSDKLIAAGLQRLVVSLQGTSADHYLRTSQVSLNFEKFLANLTYFYQHKTDTHIYLKVVDTALDDDTDKQRFFDLFGNICDTIGIEYTVPIHAESEFQEAREMTQFGQPVKEIDVCPQPFISLQLNPDLNVVPCFSFEYPAILGNAKEQSLQDIWNGPEMEAFRVSFLNRAKCNVCQRCTIMKYRLFPEDCLDGDNMDKIRAFYA